MLHLEFDDLPAELLKKVVRKRDRYERAVRALIADGQKRGEVRRGRSQAGRLRAAGRAQLGGALVPPQRGAGGGRRRGGGRHGFAGVVLDGGLSGAAPNGSDYEPSPVPAMNDLIPLQERALSEKLRLPADRQWRGERELLCRRLQDAARGAARGPGPDRHQARLRAGRVRRLRRAARRRAGAVVPGAGGRVRGARGRAPSRGMQQRRGAAPAAGLLRRSRRGAVRLLHARLPAGGRGAARAQARGDPRRDRRGALRPAVPLHRLPADLRRGGVGGAHPARRSRLSAARWATRLGPTGPLEKA